MRQNAHPRVSLSAMIIALLAMMFSGAAPPAARANGFEATVFTSDFDSLSAGALTVGTPVSVSTGSVVAEAATVAVATAAGADGQALLVSGAGAASLRFSSYGGVLPQALNSQRYELVVKAKLTAPAAGVAGAGLYLATNGGTRYEIVSFAADGTLSRDGVSLGLAYSADSPVEVEARFDLKNGSMILKLKTTAGSIEKGEIALPAAFTPDSVGQLVFAAGGAAGSYSIDKVEAKVEKDDQKKAEPAKVEVEQPEYEVEHENGATLIVLVLALNSSKGMAHDVFATITMDDSQLDLLDLSFLSGVGYVKEKGKGKIVIGIGENNRFRKGDFKFKLKFKVKPKGDQELKVELKYKLSYKDSDGAHEIAPAAIIVVVPVVVAPTMPTTTVPTDTLPISLTLPLQRLPVSQIDLRFKARWGDGDGLRLYGLPLTEPFTLTNGVTVQYFERARFEYHPENAGTPYVVLLGLLGVELGQVQPPAPPPTSTVDLAWYFVPTGHTIAPRLRSYWRDKGGLIVFGYPIGEASFDSTGAVVQYFERARLEYHPEYAGTPNEVLLGLLGEELLERIAGPR